MLSHIRYGSSRGPRLALVLLLGLLTTRGGAAPLIAQPAGGLVPTDLRVEFRTDPLGVDAAAPRLSWVLRDETGTRGQRQTAYRLLAASRADLLTPERADVWDSGRVASDSTHLVAYAGAPLAPGQEVVWAVRVWDRDGHASPWSAPGRWTVGRRGDWGGAAWVGLDSLTRAALGLDADRLPLLRRAFGLAKPVRRAVVSVSGLGHFALTVNGRAASADVLAPAWSDYAETVYYATYDVTDLLAAGENVLGVALGNGMYRVTGTPENGRFAKFFDAFGDPKLRLHLRVTHADGSETVVVSDGAWRVAGGPTTFSSIWGGEDYDARLARPGWDAPGYATPDSAWAPAALLDGPDGALRAQTTQPVRVQEVYRPVAVTALGDTALVYDFGQNVAGWPQLTVRGPAGATVTLTPAEVLTADGRADQRSMAHWGRIEFNYTLGGARAASDTLGGARSASDTLGEANAAETWHPAFTYTGFRYLQVEGATPDAARAAAEGLPLLLGLESHFLHADAARTGHVDTSSPLLDGIHEIIVDAIRSNLMHVVTDCPHREKLGWLEQSYLHAVGLQHNVDAAALYAKWTRDMAEAQLASGLVPDTAPEYTIFGEAFRDSPEWGAAVVLAPYAAYQHYGDARPLRAHYGAMTRYTAFLEAKRDSAGLLSYGLGDWYDIAPGPPGPSKLTSQGVTATATYVALLRALADIATLLGEPDDAATYATRADAVAADFNAAYFDAATGVYDRGSQTAQAMPLALGLVPAGREADVFARLVADIEAKDVHTTAGDIGHRYVLDVLARYGRSDLIVAMAVNPEPPSYAAQLLSGATTLTEAWDADPRSSQNHFMLGHLEEWFYAGMGGLRPLAPGYAEVEVRPQVVDALDYATVRYASVRGPIAVAWRRDGDRLALDVEVPPNVTALVHVPAASAADVTEGGVPAADAEGVHAEEGRVEEGTSGYAVYRVGSGAYRFESTLPR